MAAKKIALAMCEGVVVDLQRRRFFSLTDLGEPPYKGFVLSGNQDTS